MVKKQTIVAIVLLLSGCDGGSNGGGPAPFVGVLHGPINNIVESRNEWIWGDSVNWLCQSWSAKNRDVAGWFYGSNVSWSNADVFVIKSMTDPLSVVAAENFNYTTGALPADERSAIILSCITNF